MLWGLDRPGLIPHPQRVSADALVNRRRLDTAYAVTSRSSFGNFGALNIMSDLGAGLFDNVNVTLTGLVAPGHPDIPATPRWKTPDGITSFSSGSEFPGPRIYLDDAGWSVSIDLLSEATQSTACPVTYDSVADASWGCEFDYINNSRVGTDYLGTEMGTPDVWWSDAQGYTDFETVTAQRSTNLWNVLGKGGDTALMKMVVSMTKGHRKHTFMVSAMKTTILGIASVQMSDVQDIVERTWRGGDGPALLQQDLDAIGKAVDKGSVGLSMGRQHTDGYKVTSRVYQLVTAKALDISIYTIFQVLDANITLINSETVDHAPVEFEDCSTWYSNNALGGVVTGTDCITAARLDGRTKLFQGQLDTMSVFVLQGTLGKSPALTAADALDKGAWRWIQEHDSELENLVLSRAYIIAGNAGAVMVDVNILRPAISILQLILTFLPLVTFTVSWGAVLGWVGWYYQASLFSNLVTTTHEGYDGERPTFLSKPPKLVIVRGEDKVYLATDAGVFRHTGREVARMPLRVERMTEATV